jgi:hypothetical protein
MDSFIPWWLWNLIFLRRGRLLFTLQKRFLPWDPDCFGNLEFRFDVSIGAEFLFLCRPVCFGYWSAWWQGCLGGGATAWFHFQGDIEKLQCQFFWMAFPIGIFSFG